jgi:hypothetical protein
LLCDWKVDGGTCSAPICTTCATFPAPNKDLCPTHADAWTAWRASRGVTANQSNPSLSPNRENQ